LTTLRNPPLPAKRSIAKYEFYKKEIRRISNDQIKIKKERKIKIPSFQNPVRAS